MSKRKVSKQKLKAVLKKKVGGFKAKQSLELARASDDTYQVFL